MLTVGSLFTGIGGFDLGLERAGMRVVWQCEQDEFCRRVLARHWPRVPCYPDVRALVADAERVSSRPSTGAARDIPSAAGDAEGEGLQRERCGDPVGCSGPDGTRVELAGGDALPVPVPHVDVLCGGFPCQDISFAGKGAGIEGERSGLWGEYARLVGELRPRYVIVENVAALLTRGLARVVGDLAALGYDAEWDCIPASAFGAPHRRDRLWLVAYPNDAGRKQQRRSEPVPAQQPSAERGSEGMADPDTSAGPSERTAGEPLHGPQAVERSGRRGSPCGCPWDFIDADGFCACCYAHIDDPRGLYAIQGDGTHRLRGCPLADAESLRRGEGWTRRPDPSGEGEPEQPLQDADECALQPWRVGGRVAQAGGSEWWAVEPPVGRVAHGVPDRLDQLAALGNALVPQIAEWIGRRIIEWEEGRVAA